MQHEQTPQREMRKAGRVIAIICLACAGLLGLLALLTWDPGELFFGLPYFFLLPAILFALVGLVLLLITRRVREETAGEK